MNYLSEIEHLFAQKSRWDYYRCHYQLTLQQMFRYPETFINETFVCGHKHKLIESINDAPNITSARAAHSISSFFMGFILAKGLIPSHLNDFCYINDQPYEFSYVWYLASLYHDFGYRFECDKALAKRILSNVSIQSKGSISSYYQGVLYQLKTDKEFSAKHSIWNVNYSYPKYNKNYPNHKTVLEQIQEFVKKNYRELICNGNKVKMPMRSSRVINNYLKYRLISAQHRKIDHGISGGIFFYDRVLKNYISECEKEKRNNPNINLEQFFINNHNHLLEFNWNQLIVFMYVADCIINHNIWKADINSEKLYNECELKSLIGNAYEKVNFRKNPLLFILVMSDTLEPYKNFYSAIHGGDNIDEAIYNSDDVFEAYQKYKLVFVNNEINIQVPSELEEVCFNKLKTMETWIDISCERIKHGFVITIL